MGGERESETARYWEKEYERKRKREGQRVCGSDIEKERGRMCWKERDRERKRGRERKRERKRERRKERKKERKRIRGKKR